MTKGELKQIIKECLIEILTEGATSTPRQTIKTKATPTNEVRQPQQGVANKRQLNENLNNISKMTGIPAEILFDSAMSKEPIQESHPPKYSGVDIGTEYDNEENSRWAQLAFIKHPPGIGNN